MAFTVLVLAADGVALVPPANGTAPDAPPMKRRRGGTPWEEGAAPTYVWT
ncbi:hypothetical protein ACFTZI_06555 [Streptomyces decoyicus]